MLWSNLGCHRQNLIHCSRVQSLVTSCSIASGDLYPLISSCIVILGFTPTDLAECLKLNISDNALCNGGIQHLAHTLQVDQYLKRLDLANWSLTDNGLQFLAKAIQDNHTVNALFLHNSPRKFENLITENNIIPILIELQSNNTLTELYLPDNFELSRPTK